MQKIKLEKLFYNNKWQRPFSKKNYKFKTYEGTIIQIPKCNELDTEICVKSALDGLKKYKKLTNNQKSKILEKISKKIKSLSNTLAYKECKELGKTFQNAKKEMIACSKLWNHASKQVKKNKPKIIVKKKIRLHEYLEPVGVVALIIPWNFPMIVLSERLPYILAAGNSVIIKPSENGNLSIEYFIKILESQGFPKGVINFLPGDGLTGKYLVKNKNVSMISFTGSTKTGKEIYSSSSSDIKRLSLELGGKNPMAIFNDANFDSAANDIIYSFTHNAGQCCVSGSRLFIQKSSYKKFISILLSKLNKIKQFQNTVTHIQYLRIKKIIRKSLKQKNTQVIYRKEKLFDDKKRVIYPIIFRPKNKNNLLNEEIFGPVLTVDIFENLDDLVNKMNNTNYGLSALIWTKDRQKGLQLASKLNSGRIWINGNISQNYPELSIGGFKESGLNRETGESGIITYSEKKSIILN
mgnify:CR=1 FL=1